MLKTYDELEAALEKEAVKLFKDLGWEHADCYNEVCADEGSTYGRRTRADVLLPARMQPALEHVNRSIPKEVRATVIDAAIEELARDRTSLTPVKANQEIYALLKDGYQVSARDPDGGETTYTVQYVNWQEPAGNDFFLGQQFWVTGEVYPRRLDLVGFVNGIPLVFVELKRHDKRIKEAYDDNLTDYRHTIPHFFHYNAVVLLTNGRDGRIGSITSEWEHFAEWKRINDEGERGVISMETLIKGVCDIVRLLDLIENFTLFSERRGTAKLIGRNHQYLGVNRAIAAVHEIESNKGKLGVFWHTQGSGKSYSMVFFAQKILRKVPGNWTFVIVTDREDLDDQIYKNFAGCGVVTENEKQCRATSAEHLRRMLAEEDHRFVFTLIQKFRAEQPGAKFPVLTERQDVIVITDEAHRSQYDIYAMNMRDGLPGASFIGFTGTPLLDGEERTREVFGDYVSVYNFRQSIEDGATVPLYYENRIPELQLTNENLNEDLQKLLENAELEPEQEAKLARDFAREYHLITRDERLEKIAADIVEHFMGRGYAGKAMVISIDKATAVRMYDKVKFHWDIYLRKEKAALAAAENPTEREQRKLRVRFMEETDMAVVVSSAQNEQRDFDALGLEILPHRQRMQKEDLEEDFKDPAHPFRIVFVCAMWITGFDAPSCNTIYLDKPMKNHTLMQTIARANRVFGSKENGLIVDYVGVFRNLEAALAIYAAARDNDDKELGSPIERKEKLGALLADALAEIRQLCSELGVDYRVIRDAPDLSTRIASYQAAMSRIVGSKKNLRMFLAMADRCLRIIRGFRPFDDAAEWEAEVQIYQKIAMYLRQETQPELAERNAELDRQINDLLDTSIAPQGYIIHAPDELDRTDHLKDLSKIDFDALAEKFKTAQKSLEIARLEKSIRDKLEVMLKQNKERIDYYEKFQRLIDEYNRGARNTDQHFADLIDFASGLVAEERRHIRMQLSEEALAIFDILTRPRQEVDLTNKEEDRVRDIARELLETLQKEKLVLDWRKKLQGRAQVRITIEEKLEELPEKYDEKKYFQKCQAIFDHIFELYPGSAA